MLHTKVLKSTVMMDEDTKISPLSDLICVFPYGAEEKLPHRMKQVGGIEAYPVRENKVKLNVTGVSPGADSRPVKTPDLTT